MAGSYCFYRFNLEFDDCAFTRCFHKVVDGRYHCFGGYQMLRYPGNKSIYSHRGSCNVSGNEGSKRKEKLQGRILKNSWLSCKFDGYLDVQTLHLQMMDETLADLIADSFAVHSYPGGFTWTIHHLDNQRLRRIWKNPNF